MKEIWKDVIGYEGLYQVSSRGRIKRLERYTTRIGKKYHLKEKILLTNTMSSGYEIIRFYDGDRVKSQTIHRTLLLAFTGDNGEGLFVNHKNGIKSDNTLENLEWITPKGNSLHALVNRLKKTKLTDDNVLRIRYLYSTKILSQREIGILFGVTQHNIGLIVVGKTFTFLLDKQDEYNRNILLKNEKWFLQFQNSYFLNLRQLGFSQEFLYWR